MRKPTKGGSTPLDDDEDEAPSRLEPGEALTQLTDQHGFPAIAQAVLADSKLQAELGTYAVQGDPLQQALAGSGTGNSKAKDLDAFGRDLKQLLARAPSTDAAGNKLQPAQVASTVVATLAKFYNGDYSMVANAARQQL